MGLNFGIAYIDYQKITIIVSKEIRKWYTELFSEELHDKAYHNASNQNMLFYNRDRYNFLVHGFDWDYSEEGFEFWENLEDIL